jgi:hypothetical protein
MSALVECHLPLGGPVSPSHWNVRLGPSLRVAVRLTRGRRGCAEALEAALLVLAAPTRRTVTASLGAADGPLHFLGGGGPSAGTGMISTEGVSRVRLGAKEEAVEVEGYDGGGGITATFFTGFGTSGNTSTSAAALDGQMILIILWIG